MLEQGFWVSASAIVVGVTMVLVLAKAIARICVGTYFSEKRRHMRQLLKLGEKE